MLRQRGRSDRPKLGRPKPCLDRVKAKFDLHPERLIADTAYGSGPMLGWLVDRKIAPHIPAIDKAGRTDGTWSRADFEWDAENNQYICPEGEALKQFRRNYSDPNRGPTGKGVAKYQALKHTCQACPSKPKRCPKADCRKITREEHEDARDIARAIAKTTQYKVSAKLRKKSRDALCPPQTYPWPGKAPITWPMRRKRRISPRRHRPKPPGNWPRSFLHRSKRAKPEPKGTRAHFRSPLSATATRCFSTESAGGRSRYRGNGACGEVIEPILRARIL